MSRRILRYTKPVTEEYRQAAVVRPQAVPFINTAHPLYRGGGARGLTEAYDYGGAHLYASYDTMPVHYGPDQKKWRGGAVGVVSHGSGDYTGPGMVPTKWGRAFRVSGTGYYGHGVRADNSAVLLGSGTFGHDDYVCGVFVGAMEDLQQQHSPLVHCGSFGLTLDKNGSGDLVLRGLQGSTNVTSANEIPIEPGVLTAIAFRLGKPSSGNEVWQVSKDGDPVVMVRTEANGQTSSSYYAGTFYHAGFGSATGHMIGLALWNGNISDDGLRYLSRAPELLFPRLTR